MDPVDDLFSLTADHAAQFHRTLDERTVRAAASFEQVREALAGNLCRCTGYTPIVAAVHSVLAERRA